MVSDLFGSGNKVTTQEQSLLLERWQQSGSTLVNDYGVVGTDMTILTVTAGKKFYLKQLVISYGIVTNASIQNVLKDGGAAGTAKIEISTTKALSEDETQVFNFDTPLIFETDVFFNIDDEADSYGVCLIGWEE